MRLFVRPTSEVRRVATDDDRDYLTTDLVADLRQQSRSFELCAQLFVDEARTPIEDSSRVWDEGVAPPVLIATVTILRQELDSPEARELATRVEMREAFSPIVTPGLRPLGRMNPARILAYARSADHRRANVPRGRNPPSRPPSGRSYGPRASRRRLEQRGSSRPDSQLIVG